MSHTDAKSPTQGLTPRRGGLRATIALTLLACGVLASCGGGSGGTGTEVSNGRLKPVAGDTAFMDLVKQLIQAREASGLGATERLAATATLAVAAASPVASADSSSGTPPNFSGTTQQEAAVAEDDLIKTDGSLIYTFKAATDGASAHRVQAHRRNSSDGSLSPLTPLSLARPTTWDYPVGLQLASSARRVAALRHGYQWGGGSACPDGAACLAASFWAMNTSTLVDLLALQSDGALASSAAVQAQIQGDLVASRMIGNTLYLITTHRPSLQAQLAATQAQRDLALAALTAADVLPTVRINGGASQALVQASQCYVEPSNGSTQVAVTTITAVNLAASDFAWQSRCFVGGTEAAYMSADNLYLATARWPEPVRQADGSWVYPSDPTISTDIHKFSINAADMRYRASGTVQGHLGWVREQTSYRLSEHNSDLRVLSFTGSLGWAVAADATRTPASPATLTVLREDAASATLQTVGTLPNASRPAAIGLPGEQVQAVRFLGNQAYVVTFRQTDPLYVLDLSNPSDPRQVGELKITGFSSHLFPVGSGLLLGVGHDATTTGARLGVKVALFDVATPSDPRVLQSFTYGGPWSWSAVDASPHGISLFTQGNITRVGLPMQLSDVSANAMASAWTLAHGLHRFEVDAGARSLRALSTVGATTSSQWFDLSQDRSVHIDGHVYFYSDGVLSGSLW